MILSPSEVRMKGLEQIGVRRFPRTTASQELLFRQHYGSSSITLADMWCDLHETDLQDAKLTSDESTPYGFKMFLMAHFFLWTYPKNRGIIQSRFHMNKNYCGGKHLWRWIKKFQAMKEEVIIWGDYLDDPDTEKYALTVDCTDLRNWEPASHPFYNVDRQEMSSKHKHAAKKFEIALAVFHQQIAFISGPYSGGTHDLKVFRKELKHRIMNGKLVIADRGYISSKLDEQMLCTPSWFDHPDVLNFKSRARLRHETLNGRMHNYKTMRDTWRHGGKKLGIAFEAVAVIIQYQMDSGEELFSL